MPIVRRSSSRIALAVISALGGGLTLAGCTGGNLVESASAVAKDARTATHERVEPARDATTGSLYAARPGPGQTKRVGRATGAVTRLRTEPTPGAHRSERCRELEALAGVRTTMLRSPTVNATARANGAVGASVGYDLVDLRRARLVEEEADALCRRNLAAARVKGYVSSAADAISHAGLTARANSIETDRHELAAVRNAVSWHLRQGTLTMPQAGTLRQFAARIEAGGEGARADAKRREVVGVDRAKLFDRAVSQLIAAEHDLAEIARRQRTADAVSLSVSGGYSDTTNPTDLRNAHGETYGLVKMSVRTGALLPGRHAYEDVATASRIAALDDAGTGSVWRLGELHRAARRSIASLEAQVAQLRIGIAEAERMMAEPPSPLDDGLEVKKLRTRLDLVTLRADLAAARATLADMHSTVGLLGGK